MNKTSYYTNRYLGQDEDIDEFSEKEELREIDKKLKKRIKRRKLTLNERGSEICGEC